MFAYPSRQLYFHASQECADIRAEGVKAARDSRKRSRLSAASLHQVLTACQRWRPRSMTQRLFWSKRDKEKSKECVTDWERDEKVVSCIQSLNIWIHGWRLADFFFSYVPSFFTVHSRCFHIFSSLFFLSFWFITHPVIWKTKQKLILAEKSGH